MLTLFPDLRPEVEKPDYTIYQAFFDLLPRVREAHLSGDEESLRRIYGFAEWCAEQPAQHLWNAAGVAFYEHLFDSDRQLWGAMVRLLSPRVVAKHWVLWESRLPGEHLAEVRRLLVDRCGPRFHEARLSRSKSSSARRH
jgi:hypothetical protein